MVALLVVLIGCGGPSPSPAESTEQATPAASTAVECRLSDEALCRAITEAAAEQLPSGARALLIEDAMYCDTTMLGPACDRPPLEHLAGVLVTLPDGRDLAYKAWRDESGRLLLFDNQPRPNETNPYAP